MKQCLLKLVVVLLVLVASMKASAQPQITEIMASNSRTLADEDGEFPDWIEIHNSGSQNLNLGGWFLTDSTNHLAKWQFPSTNLAAGQYLIVFASEKNRRDVGAALHTNFKLTTDGEYLALLDPQTNVVSAFSPAYPRQAPDVSFGVGTSGQTVRFISPEFSARVLIPPDGSLGMQWIASGFDDTTWPSGTCAVGYENAPENYAQLIKTDVRATMANRNGSCYIRVPFVVTNLTQLSAWKLRIQFDDGFVAWLNGAEVASRNAPDDPLWNSFATANNPDEQAVLAEEFDLTPYQDRFVTGTNWLAIQGLNVSLSSSDFLIVASLEAERTATQQTGLRYFLNPTPGAPNRAGTATVGPLILDTGHRPQVPSVNESLVINARVASSFRPVGSVTLHYRVMFAAEVTVPMFDDGAHDDGAARDGLFGARIPADAATPGQMIRYRITATDTAGEESRLPLFLDPRDSEEYFGTIVRDPTVDSRLLVLHLFVQTPGAADTQTGTRASIFYLDEFYDNLGVSLHGQSTSGFPKKGYNVDFNRDHRFRYQTNAARVKDLKLLTNWADKSRVRNTLAYEMIHAAGSVGHFAFPVRVQRNGQFHAILDMVEDGDDRWLERLGRDPNGALYKIYNALDSAGGSEKKTRKDENASDLQNLVDNLNTSRPMADRVLYAYDNLDLPQIVSYFTALALISSQDHGHKNFYLYRDSLGSGEWALFPWDVDLSWGRNWTDSGGYFTDTLYQDNLLSFYQSAQQNKPANRLYSLIFTHPDFRRMYLRRLRTVMDTLLKPPGTAANELPIEARVRELVDLMDPPDVAQSDADLDYAKWGSWGNRNQTRPEAQRILDLHLPGRRAFLFNNSAATLNGEAIPTSQPINVRITLGEVEFNPVSRNQDEEFVQLMNTESYAVDISGWQLTGGIEFTFKPGTVIPANGSLYVSPNVAAFRARAVGPRRGQGLFVQGNYQGRLSAWGETLTLADDHGRAVGTKTYPGNPSSAQRFLRITEIMFNPASPPGDADAQEYEFIELKNIGSTTLELTGIRFSKGVDFQFTSSSASSLGPGQFALLVKNAGMFARRYRAGLPVVGQFTGSLDNSGETLRLDDATGEKTLEFSLANNWQALADGRGHSLVFRDETAPWSEWNLPEHWRASTRSGGSPGEDDPPASSEADADGDGMPDYWELAYGLDPSSNDAVADPDGDGLANLQEFIAGTDPRDTTSVFQINVIQSGTEVRLTFHAVADREYRVLYKSDLLDPDWTELMKVPASNVSREETLRDLNPTHERRFYRLEVYR